MPEPNSEWELIVRCPRRGHKFFRHLPSGRIAVADYSGYTPDQTEDGVLWLDHSRPVTAYLDAVRVPVVSERTGERLWCSDPVAGMVGIARMLGLELMAGGELAELLEALFQADVGVRVGQAVRRVA